MTTSTPACRWLMLWSKPSLTKRHGMSRRVADHAKASAAGKRPRHQGTVSAAGFTGNNTLQAVQKWRNQEKPMNSMPWLKDVQVQTLQRQGRIQDEDWQLLRSCVTRAMNGGTGFVKSSSPKTTGKIEQLEQLVKNGPTHYFDFLFSLSAAGLDTGEVNQSSGLWPARPQQNPTRPQDGQSVPACLWALDMVS